MRVGAAHPAASPGPKLRPPPSARPPRAAPRLQATPPPRPRSRRGAGLRDSKGAGLPAKRAGPRQPMRGLLRGAEPRGRRAGFRRREAWPRSKGAGLRSKGAGLREPRGWRWRSAARRCAGCRSCSAPPASTPAPSNCSSPRSLRCSRAATAPRGGPTPSLSCGGHGKGHRAESCGWVRLSVQPEGSIAHPTPLTHAFVDWNVRCVTLNARYAAPTCGTHVVFLPRGLRGVLSPPSVPPSAPRSRVPHVCGCAAARARFLLTWP